MSEKEQKQIYITARMPAPLAHWARRYAARRNVSRSEVVRQALKMLKEKKGTREK